MSRTALVGLAVACAVLTVTVAEAIAPASVHNYPVARHAVLAELFTSEGCSSCPAADRLLQQIALESPVDGVEVIGLEEHVDYWDRLGWRDPFSSAAFTNRQSEYGARVFHTAQVYTPQLVVDGAIEAVGSDRRSVHEAVGAAAARPGLDVRVRASMDAGRVHVDVDLRDADSVRPHGAADVMVALAEDDLSSHVARGENSGRTLTHAAVVRSLTSIGVLPPDSVVSSMSADVPLMPSWRAPYLRVIAFVQLHDSRRILGVARGSLVAS